MEELIRCMAVALTSVGCVVLPAFFLLVSVALSPESHPKPHPKSHPDDDIETNWKQGKDGEEDEEEEKRKQNEIGQSLALGLRYLRGSRK